MAKRGRPSTYTPKIGALICESIASGNSIRKAAEACGLEQGQIFRWLAAQPAFREQYMRARDYRADARFEEADEIKADLRAGTIDANQARVLLDAVKWQTGKEAPKRYGDHLGENGGASGGPAVVLVIGTAGRPRAAAEDIPALDVSVRQVGEKKMEFSIDKTTQ